MDLLEYQAKELFRTVGIPVLPSQRIDRPKDLRNLTIPYPVVLKSQVYIGGRGRMGGVRFVENTIDAVAAAQTIFNLPIMGEYPKALLAEAKFDAVQEFYLAVTLNRSIRRPVLLGSCKGGMEVQSAIDQMQQVVVDGDFSPFYARQLALKMGLQGDLMNAVSAVIEKMYWLMDDKDLDLVEINPLAVDSAGQIMALDGKVTVNDGSLGRHPDLASLSESPIINPLDLQPELQMTMETDGTIGIICNGAGLTMATLDLVYQMGGKPLCFLNIGSETHHQWLPSTLCQRLEQGLARMGQQSQLKVILINLVGGIVSCQEIAQTLVQFLQAHTRNMRTYSRGQEESIVSRVVFTPQIIVRLVGKDYEAAKETLSGTSIVLLEDLDESIRELMSRVKRSKS
ncbi:MAG: ATPase [Alkalinema sp. CACIAM 70d]|nr:MAG: ATPase [Alkalinema sp. CACIAM 70d]